jgi:hypothetical protein
MPRLEFRQPSSLETAAHEDREEDDEEDPKKVGEEANSVLHCGGSSLPRFPPSTFKENLLFL